MPLSEHEERILAEIERQLADEDPRFASASRRAALRGPFSSWSRTLRLRLAIGLAVVGLLSLVGLAANIAFGIVGIAMIFAAVLVGATAVRERFLPSAGPRPPDAE